MNTQALTSQGKTTSYSNMAESVAHRIQDLRKSAVREMLSDFTVDMNRLSSVATIRGVEYIDDSCAESSNAVWFALENVHKTMHWIMDGNSDNIGNADELRVWVDKKVKMMICIGHNKKIESLFSSVADRFISVQSIEEAIRVAYLYADEGQAVLYAPLLSGKNAWESKENRSLRFRKAVNEL